MKNTTFTINNEKNLDKILGIELKKTNKTGSYLNTTILNCNTRQTHGLLISPIKELDNNYHVLLSTIDESVIINKHTYNLGQNKYPGKYEPNGIQFLAKYEGEQIPTITYKTKDFLLKKEISFSSKTPRLLIQYTLLNAKSTISLRLKPFLAFRYINALSKANLDVNTKYIKIRNGIKNRLYHPYPELCMQISKKNEFIPIPDWYYNIEYTENQKYEDKCREDLYVPGFFELGLKKGESIVFTAGLDEISPLSIKKHFNKEIRNIEAENISEKP